MAQRLAGLGAGLLLVAAATLSLGPTMAFAAGGDAPPGHSADHQPPGQVRKAADAAPTDVTQLQDSAATDSSAVDSQPPGQVKKEAREAAAQGAAQPGASGPAAAPASPASASSETSPSTGRSGNAGGADKAAKGDGATAQAAGAVSAATSSTTVTKHQASNHSASKSHGSKNRPHSSAGSGPLDQPQPVSNADQNSGGANGQCPGGPYCSTRDGSPSANGNGNGKATGKPCAGCVGKADNKNPKGQMPNGSDHNNGYECDGNHGIGRSNPAHTGCQPPPACIPTAANNNCQPPPPPCVPTPANNMCTTPPPCVPTPANNMCTTPPPCVPTPANNMCTTPPPCVPTPANNRCTTPPATCTPDPANNQCQVVPPVCVPAAGEDENCAAVEGTKFGSTPPVQARTVPAATQAGTLPHTGAGLVANLLTVGLFLLVLGATLVRSGRRRRSTT